MLTGVGWVLRLGGLGRLAGTATGVIPFVLYGGASGLSSFLLVSRLADVLRCHVESVPVSPHQQRVVAAAHVGGFMPLAPSERHEVVPLFLGSSLEGRVAGSVRPRLCLLVDSDLEVGRVNPPALDARTVVAETRCGGHLAGLLLALVVTPITHSIRHLHSEVVVTGSDRRRGVGLDARLAHSHHQRSWLRLLSLSVLTRLPFSRS